MKTALLDVNVLIALFWPDHEHHEAAIHWLGGRRSARWATCPLTQLAFIRLVSNPVFSREALTPANAAELLCKNIDKAANHEFWPDDLDVPDALHTFESNLRSYRQITDAYLIRLAAEHKSALATFDRGMRNVAGDRLAGVIEMVPV